jgi:hypothetical protein
VGVGGMRRGGIIDDVAEVVSCRWTSMLGEVFDDFHSHRYQLVYAILKLMVPPLSGRQTSEIRRCVFEMISVSHRYQHVYNTLKPPTPPLTRNWSSEKLEFVLQI